MTAVLSRGPERHPVPTLAGQPLDQAQAAVAEASLSFGTATYRYSETVDRGVVVRSDPAPETRLRRDGVVDVVVSRGPRPVAVPDWTGRDAKDATTALEKRGFEVRTSEENSDTVEKGDVIRQSPDRGTRFKGDPVALVVSKGPVLVEVPSVLRKGRQRDRDPGGGGLRRPAAARRGLHRPQPRRPAVPRVGRPGAEGQHGHPLRRVRARR